MRILHAIHAYPPEFTGGTEAYLSALAAEQARAGHDVRIVAGSETPGRGIREEVVDGIPVARFLHDGRRFAVAHEIPEFTALLRERLDAFRPDVLHVHHYMNLFAPLARLGRAAGARVVLTLHDYLAICPRFFLLRPDGGFCGDALPVPRERCVACCLADHGGPAAALEAELDARKAFFAAETGAADVILAPSERAACLLTESGLLPAGTRIDALPLGLLRPLTPPVRQREDDGRLALVSFGNVAPAKGLEILARACGLLEPSERARLSVRILGRIVDEEHARRLREAFAALPEIEAGFEGAFDVERLGRAAAAADVAVFPSLAAETYALVVDEALALGLPVIVSDRGAAAERAGAAGLVVRTGDADDLARALRLLLDPVEGPTRVRSMRGAAGASTITIADHARRLLDRYAPPPSRMPDTLPPHDPSFTFLPLHPFDAVPGGRVVVLAPHPDDEIIGAGGALAMHAARGDEVVIVHLTDGAAGDRENRAAGSIRTVRREEAERAGAIIGVRSFVALEFPDGALAPEGAFLAALRGRLDTLRPDVLYAPSPFEHHPDHRATFQLAARALAVSGLRPRVLLYEVNEPQAASWLLDITAVLDVKRRALECFTSQRAYLDLVEKTLAANRARTVNVDVASVAAAEAYLEIGPERLPELAELAHDLRVFARRAASESAGDAAHVERSSTRVVPVTAVISTWNKRDDVRENLLALHRQSAQPAEIVVVDNASKDGTADMIRREFPDVKLIVMPHDRKGACETFNIGMKAATQPFTAIMDDDVVAPAEWLETLFERMRREPSTTAMVSSNVVEPGMPPEFMAAEQRERYMATFRGCGTLARSDVLRKAGYYDERFFIYGNERDLASRVLNLGYRILQHPEARIFHKTPFGMKAGKRSLYYHVRNFWLYAFKYCSVVDILRVGTLLGLKGLGLRRRAGHAVDASGTIGIDRAVKETPGGLWIAAKATLAAVALLPHCLRRREVCRSPDFQPPVA